MAVEGNLQAFQLVDVLQLISQQGKTGILTVQGGNDIIAISFLQGKVVAADALNETVEEGLTRVLVEQGLLTPEQVTRITTEYRDGGGRLLDVLVERRQLTRVQVLEALRVQTSRLLERVLQWREGEFKFYSGEEVSYEEGFVPIRVDEFLLRLAGKETEETAPPPAAAPAPMARPTPVEEPPGGEPPKEPVAQPVPKEARKIEILTGALRMGRVLALALVGVLVVLVLRWPTHLVLPFPWQGDQRVALERQLRASLYLKIDRGAKTYFLLEGHFPENLQTLVGLRLLSPWDLEDASGKPLAYSAREESYVVQPIEGLSLIHS